MIDRVWRARTLLSELETLKGYNKEVQLFERQVNGSIGTPSLSLIINSMEHELKRARARHDQVNEHEQFNLFQHQSINTFV